MEHGAVIIYFGLGIHWEGVIISIAVLHCISTFMHCESELSDDLVVQILPGGSLDPVQMRLRSCSSRSSRIDSSISVGLIDLWAGALVVQRSSIVFSVIFFLALSLLSILAFSC